MGQFHHDNVITLHGVVTKSKCVCVCVLLLCSRLPVADIVVFQIVCIKNHPSMSVCLLRPYCLPTNFAVFVRTTSSKFCDFFFFLIYHVLE